MDVFIYLSLSDGLPNALLETIACESGRFVRTNDASEPASGINELLSDKNVRTKLGSTTRQTVAKKFTLQAELDGNLALYRGLGLKM